MRFGVIAALLFGLLMVADITYLWGSRSRDAHKRYEELQEKRIRDLHEKEGRAFALIWDHQWQGIRQRNKEKEQELFRKRIQEVIETRGRLLEEEVKTQSEALLLSSEFRRGLEVGQQGILAALVFLGCVLIWLVMILATRRATEPRSLLHRTLKASILGAIVVGTCFTCIYGVGNWLDGYRDRLDWEVRWLVGAIGGAAIGALFGLLAGVILQLLRKNQSTGRTDVSMDPAGPAAPASQAGE